MLDVVVNHFAWAGEGTTVDYSTFNPFNSKDYFHPYRLLSQDDPNNATAVQMDWYSGNEITLPDVKTEDPKVAQMYNSWIKGLVSNYSGE
jgi:alpha-amylase